MIFKSLFAFLNSFFSFYQLSFGFHMFSNGFYNLFLGLLMSTFRPHLPLASVVHRLLFQLPCAVFFSAFRRSETKLIIILWSVYFSIKCFLNFLKSSTIAYFQRSNYTRWFAEKVIQTYSNLHVYQEIFYVILISLIMF